MFIGREKNTATCWTGDSDKSLSLQTLCCVKIIQEENWTKCWECK